MLNAVRNLIQRKDFVKSLAREGKGLFSMSKGYFLLGLLVQIIKIPHDNDPSVVQTLMSRNEAVIREPRQRIVNLSGDKLFAFIEEEQKQLKKAMYDPRKRPINSCKRA